jgi:Kyakuja-Dileera-Zisupton transposase
MLTKKSKGLRATGMAAVSCTRHQLFRPLGMGDLQMGERCVHSHLLPTNVLLTICCSQCNMDYLFTSSIAGCGLQLVTISYDVGCQWFVKFWNRVPRLPEFLRRSLTSINIRPLVPKFHLQSHIEACHSTFSFNFFKGGAQTDGEGVERNWKELNGHGPSTSEMLPGARWDTLDDCCGWVNWRKTMGLGV